MGLVVKCKIPHSYVTASLRLLFRHFNLLNAESNPICHLLALLAHHILYVSRVRVNWSDSTPEPVTQWDLTICSAFSLLLKYPYFLIANRLQFSIFISKNYYGPWSTRGTVTTVTTIKKRTSPFLVPRVRMDAVLPSLFDVYSCFCA